MLDASDYLDPFLHYEGWGNASDVMGFRSVLKLTPSHPRNPNFKYICEKIKSSSAKPPFCVPYHHKIFDSISVPIQAAYLYDAVMIYARALTEVFKNNEDPRNGTAILHRIINRSYHSIQGYDVFIDDNGDAEGNFTVVALLDDKEMNGTIRMSMQPVGYFQYKSNGSNKMSALPEFKYFDLDRPIQWVGGKLPRAEPKCGFYGEKCIYRIDWKLVASMVLVSTIVLVGILFAVRHYRYEQKLACLLWKIDMKDVTIIPTETTEIESQNMKMVCFLLIEILYLYNNFIENFIFISRLKMARRAQRILDMIPPINDPRDEQQSSSTIQPSKLDSIDIQTDNIIYREYDANDISSLPDIIKETDSDSDSSSGESSSSSSSSSSSFSSSSSSTNNLKDFSSDDSVKDPTYEDPFSENRKAQSDSDEEQQLQAQLPGIQDFPQSAVDNQKLLNINSPSPGVDDQPPSVDEHLSSIGEQSPSVDDESRSGCRKRKA
ncbi:unnamed protein product [Diabrotica balteata]|uniref:Receptor ligand binding region domain-containing protein n=1 Tax=Diabrotica balteata TaxID=107213 RepID=A0A9N9SQR8_DIABA|nr:unnamed protein product [Diabrotica balteata]